MKAKQKRCKVFVHEKVMREVRYQQGEKKGKKTPLTRDENSKLS